MTSMKIRLLTATTLVAIAATANAQTAYPLLPAAELRAAGATAVGPITAVFLNCIGRNGAGNAYGTNSGQLLPQTAGNYVVPTQTATNPNYSCTSEEVQPDFTGAYVGTGSGTGRAWWRSFTNQLPGTGASNINPFAPTTGAWTNVQFAFSEGPISTSDLTTYNQANANATQGAGAPIQIPFFVVPVAVVYNPKYGVDTVAGTDLNFNIKTPVKTTVNGVSTVVGGLRLNRDAYCRIFNGNITNWNHPALRFLNGGARSSTGVVVNPGTPLGAASDVLSGRWAAEGATIRLVGRADASGTSDIFTRHLAAVCGVVANANAADSDTTNDFVNKFVQAGDSLPYNAAAGNPNITVYTSNTRYNPNGVANANFAGTIQSLSGAFFDRVSGSILTLQGNEAPGLWMVADGSSGVEQAIRTEGSTLVSSASNPAILLNGKLGYISADFTIPAPLRTMHSAALQRGTSTTAYDVASVANSSKSFGTVLPPQTTAASGAYNIADARTSALGGPLSRTRPQDWSQALYPTGPLTGLAAPTNGYAITGVSYMLTYTCFSTTAKRLAVANMIGVGIGKVTKLTAPKIVNGGNTVTLSGNTFKGVAPTSPGIFTQFGIGVVPAAWQNAISETFLKRSTQLSGGGTLGALNLWIQDRAPVKATDFDGIVAAGNTEILDNPVCSGNTGA